MKTKGYIRYLVESRRAKLGKVREFGWMQTTRLPSDELMKNMVIMLEIRCGWVKRMGQKRDDRKGGIEFDEVADGFVLGVQVDF